MRAFRSVTFFICFFLFVSLSNVYAIDLAKDYTLPYPPTMPGGITYKLRVAEEMLLGLWSFGSIAQFHYNLSESDKYLVQAKTLLEYEQYLLADQALQTSNNYFQKAHSSLNNAKQEGKNVSDIKNTLQNAAKKHIEILQFLLTQTPAQITWSPENAPVTTINFSAEINQAIDTRKTAL